MKIKKLSKKGLSPMTATFILIVFSILLGTVVMALTKDKLDVSIPNQSTEICLSIDSLDSFKELQIQYLEGDISKDDLIKKQDQLKNS